MMIQLPTAGSAALPLPPTRPTAACARGAGESSRAGVAACAARSALPHPAALHERAVAPSPPLHLQAEVWRAGRFAADIRARADRVLARAGARDRATAGAGVCGARAGAVPGRRDRARPIAGTRAL